MLTGVGFLFARRQWSVFKTNNQLTLVGLDSLCALAIRQHETALLATRFLYIVPFVVRPGYLEPHAPFFRAASYGEDIRGVIFG